MHEVGRSNEEVAHKISLLQTEKTSLDIWIPSGDALIQLPEARRRQEIINAQLQILNWFLGVEGVDSGSFGSSSQYLPPLAETFEESNKVL